MLRKRRSQYERVHNHFNYPDYLADRCVADVALQRRMGLLPERWFGLGGPDRRGSVVVGQNIARLRQSDGIAEPAVRPWTRFFNRENVMERLLVGLAIRRHQGKKGGPG